MKRVVLWLSIALALLPACETKSETPLLPPEPEIVPRTASPREPAPPLARADAATRPRRSAAGFVNPDEVPGEPPITRLPAGFAGLAKATRVEIRDQWNGLGPTHDVYVRLVRQGARFALEAKVGSYPGGLGEAHRDPTSPWMKYAEPCVCEVDAKCECEHGSVKHETGSVAASVVERFLGMVASYTLDAKQDHETGMRWTDDYPKGHVAVWVPGSTAPIHLSFLDQRRHWRVGGAFLASDTDSAESADGLRSPHAKLHAAYTKMLESLGLKRWRQKRGRGGL